MRRTATILITLATTVLVINCAMAQRTGFVNVSGGDLASKLSNAQRQGRGGASRAFWIAYAFPVRRNVAVDVTLGGGGGSQTELGGAITGNVGEYETRNLGVFLLYGAGGAGEPERVEVYNLDRQRDYEGHPVYWLGSAGASESLALLRHLVGQAGDGSRNVNLTEAIALHDDPQSEVALEELARNASTEAGRVRAVFWLGRLGGHIPLLSALARDASEPLAVRSEAVRSIGKGPDPNALETLQELYTAVSDLPVKGEIIDAAAKSRRPGAVDFLTHIAQSDENDQLSQRARSRLAKATGEKQRQKGDKSSLKGMKTDKP